MNIVTHWQLVHFTSKWTPFMFSTLWKYSGPEATHLDLHPTRTHVCLGRSGSGMATVLRRQNGQLRVARAAAAGPRRRHQDAAPGIPGSRIVDFRKRGVGGTKVLRPDVWFHAALCELRSRVPRGM